MAIFSEFLKIFNGKTALNEGFGLLSRGQAVSWGLLCGAYDRAAWDGQLATYFESLGVNGYF